MKNKYGFRFLALCLTLMLALGMASSAMAATEIVGTTIYTGKTLEMGLNDNVPTAAFDFTIQPGTAKPAEWNEDHTAVTSPQILAGVAGAAITGVSFSPADTAAADPKDATKKIVSKKIAIDLSGCKFTQPGIYRYEITESATSIPGVTNDANPVRYLDVFVDSDAAGNLTIQGQYMYKVVKGESGDDVLKIGGSDDQWGQADADTEAYRNSFTTKKLTVSKVLEGNQAFRSKYFQLDVTITGAAVRTKFDVTHAAAFGLGSTATLPLVADATGKATGTFWIKGGESFDVHGLTSGESYQVVETISDDEGYTVSYNIDNAANYTSGKDTAVQAVGTPAADHDVKIKNYRNGVVPTGILLDIWPYLLIVAVAAVALVVLLSNKRKQATRY